jgi:hypothetical protein
MCIKGQGVTKAFVDLDELCYDNPGECVGRLSIYGSIYLHSFFGLTLVGYPLR